MVKNADVCFEETSFSVYTAVYETEVERDAVGERVKDKAGGKKRM